MKLKLIVLFLFCLIGTSLMAQENRWLPGHVVLNTGEKVNGQVRGWMKKGRQVVSIKFRKSKDDKTVIYKAKDIREVKQEDLLIVSVKKKKNKKAQFYITIYQGDYLSAYYDPEAKRVSRLSTALNVGQYLSFLVFKDGELKKITKLNFRKPIAKLCSDNEKWVELAENKEWFQYSNLYEVVKVYNEQR
ncbi:hypothetical protein DF185_16305 [Marinifilum breve]|uniref:Uncharacterized protein n=1 Tax=Marinifilum breve TaxID=2184082 RepID=A0A2V3ZU92_9BACT|nr:hypothetical protein [Marinifilum breve]PXX98933.1 hypothetical protein DF185_16305 [Marinifilum breve]